MIKHWINGREVESKEVFENLNPATGEVICEVASGGAEEIAQAVAAAKEAFPKWANTPAKERARLMRKLGELIDQNYLNAIGWRGIRQRKLHVEELLREAIRRLREQQRPVHIVDIAAGHGRYILEALQEQMPDSILLRDYSELNVQQGSALIAEKGLTEVARFVQGDAFDRQSLATLEQPPTLAVVSGLYELFASNQLVGNSLAGLADALEDGGYLVYTGQPWHPQLEMIARALTSHRGGEAWVMRRRSQAEMDQLVEAAGFRKLAQRIDEWGIFSVSLAQRVR